jgi:hypothetical protein
MLPEKYELFPKKYLPRDEWKKLFDTLPEDQCFRDVSVPERHFVYQNELMCIKEDK